MANVNRLEQKEKTVVFVWLEIYLVCLLPFPAADSTAQRCKNAHRVSPLGTPALVLLLLSRLANSTHA